MADTARKTSTRSQPAARGAVQYVNPDGMIKNPAFTHAIAASGPVKTIYVGAQTPMDGSGTIIGKEDMVAQTEQVLKNIEACLAAAEAKPEHIVKWNIYIVAGQPIQAAYQASMRWWGGRPNPPTNSVFFVAGFPMLPDVLIQIDAVAVVPD